MRRRLRDRYQQRRRLVPPANLTEATISVDGLPRTYWSAEPPAEPTSAPLLIALHGAGGQGPGMAALSGLATFGPAAGFTTVFPDGVQRVWNDSRTGKALRRREHIDDVGFLQALVARFTTEGRARGDRVYLAGMSNGALMSEHIARNGLLPVAGIGLVAGPGTQTSRTATPVPIRPATVVVFAGTADPLIPYAGGAIGLLGRMVQRRGNATERGLAVGAEAAVHDWATANGLTGPPDVTPLRSPSDLTVTRSTWHGESRPPVVLYRIEGGGHTWPGGSQYLPARLIGPITHTVDATAIILDQFRSWESLNR